MSKSFVVMRGVGAYGDNTTRFSALGGHTQAVITELSIEKPVRDAGTFSNLYCYVSTNTASVTSTVTLRKSQVNTALTLSYTSDQTGIKEDNANSVAFAATDEADIEVTVPNEAGTNTMTVQMMGCEFAPDTSTNCVTFLYVGIASGISMNTANVTRFFPPNGESPSGWSVSEATSKYRIRSACVAQDFYTYVSANSRTTDCIFGTRVDGGNGAQSVTYTSGQTGAKEDTSNTDTLTTGQDYNYRLTTSTGAEFITWSNSSSNLVSTDNRFHLLASNGGTAVGADYLTLHYFGVAGDLVDAVTTEVNAEIYPRFTFTARELQCYASANTLAGGTASAIVVLRDNNADSALTFTYTSGQTGLKTDSSNTAEITTGTDEISYKVDPTGATSGTISLMWMSLLGESGAAPQTSTPAAVVLSVAIGVASLLAGGVASTPASTLLDAAVSAPTILNAVVVQPASVALSALMGVPVILPGAISSAPAATPLGVAVPAPVISNGNTVQPASVGLEPTVGVPVVVQGGVVSALSSVGLDIGVPIPVVVPGAVSSTPASVPLAIEIQAATVKTSQSSSPVSVAMDTSYAELAPGDFFQSAELDPTEITALIGIPFRASTPASLGDATLLTSAIFVDGFPAPTGTAEVAASSMEDPSGIGDIAHVIFRAYGVWSYPGPAILTRGQHSIRYRVGADTATALVAEVFPLTGLDPPPPELLMRPVETAPITTQPNGQPWTWAVIAAIADVTVRGDWEITPGGIIGFRIGEIMGEVFGPIGSTPEIIFVGGRSARIGNALQRGSIGGVIRRERIGNIRR